jgi:hypothetical protein
MPLIAAFTAAEAAAAITAAEAAAAITAAEAAAAAQAATAAQTATAATTAATTAAEAAAAQAATAAVPEALSATSFAPQTGGIMEALPGQLQNVRSLASGPGIQFAGLDPAAAANALPTAGSNVATTAGASPTTIAGDLTPLAQTTVNPGGITGVTASAPPPMAAQPTAADFARAGIDPASMVQPSSGILQAAPPAPPNSGPLVNNYGNTYTLDPNAAPAPNLADFQPAKLPPGAEAEAGRVVEGSTNFDKFAKFAKDNPFMTGASMYMSAAKLGMMGQKSGGAPEKKSYGPQYRLSENFQAATPAPNVYTPSYPQYAEGGVMAIDGPEDQMPTTRMEDGDAPGYAKGGTLSDSLDFYRKMTETQRPSTSKGASAPKADADVGIYYDQDPDTRYQDALTAAQIRQAKLNKRSNMQVPTGGVMRRPTPMGQINLAPPRGKAQDGGGTMEAAQGGIMQARDSSLGGYAAGGNPRLLKGPGDGMSDNIPAMIGRRQPARLADGEFVIPADVVSHLGNGSTEAGAKRLHEMMNNVRRARTGNPKQGKQINPKKYMPK